ncbi:MAG: winged helix-turn-helix domain-containing protein [Candidatus Ranarchaeia archaeon]
MINVRGINREASHCYRSYWDLYAAILVVCYGHPRTISFIVRATNQKHVSVRKHLGFLLEKGLIEEKMRSKRVYITTSSGITYLEKYLDLWNHIFDRQKNRKSVR